MIDWRAFLALADLSSRERERKRDHVNIDGMIAIVQ